MIPLSCVNCCHNPLQTGSVGYPVGYCTRLRVTLLAPSQTTCGALQRKDLQRERADGERKLHARKFSPFHVFDLATRKRTEAIEKAPHPVEAADPVIREVMDYGVVSKIATLASLRTMSGARAELAVSSLGRSYFANCMRRSRTWTAGLHLAWWMLRGLTEQPKIEITDLRQESSQTLDERVELAKWFVVSARLMLLLDVAHASRNQKGANGVPRLAPLIIESFVKVPAGKGGLLLRFLGQRRHKFEAALPEKHYAALANELHKDGDEQEEL